MNFDPQKFFIGLMDFFSILLPGALLTYLLMGELGPVVLSNRYANLDGAQAWAAFLFASYLFGHLVFLLGFWLDEFYDWARRYTVNTQIALLASRSRLLPWFARALSWQVFKRGRNLAVDPCRQDQGTGTRCLLGRLLQSRASEWEYECTSSKVVMHAD